MDASETISPIAEQVITRCGGTVRVATLLKIGHTAVSKWKAPRSKGGAGGLVPAKHQGQLLTLARQEGIDLTPDDFFTVRPAPAAEGA